MVDKIRKREKKLYEPTNPIVLGLIIFSVTTLLFYLMPRELWFREDDLGTIINGLVKDWNSFFRVFTADCRSFICPINYQRSLPNVLSGLLRPMQNLVFSLIHSVVGLNAWTFYGVHVMFHAANAALFFFLSHYWMPLNYSVFAGLLFAFFPSVSWLTWAATLQNSLAVFFILLTMLCVYSHAKSFSLVWQGVAGVLFFCSLLSRETGVLLPLWFFFGAYLFIAPATMSFVSRCKIAFSYTWVFFAVNALYFLLRLWSFGVSTLSRSFNTIALHFPFLSKLLGLVNHNDVSIAVNAAASATPDQVAAIKKIPIAYTFGAKIFNAGYIIVSRFFSWISALFNYSAVSRLDHFFGIILFTLFGLLMWWAYKNYRIQFIWLITGLGCLAWPGIVAYPSPRYINGMFPLLIFFVVYGVYLFLREHRRDSLHGFMGGVAIFCGVALVFYGGYQNYCQIDKEGRLWVSGKKRFDDFFKRHNFDGKRRFVVLGSPFTSDIQSIFQAYLHNMCVTVVHEPFATFAQKGCMGCRQEYQVIGVSSKITTINGGFRFTSHDHEKCGWWLRFSDHPIQWSQANRCYQLTPQQYKQGKWYPCSIGKFKINSMISSDCVADIEFVIDKQWFDQDTVFVTWDSLNGSYKLLDASHLLTQS